jgi:hypothetical protein
MASLRADKEPKNFTDAGHAPVPFWMNVER